MANRSIYIKMEQYNFLIEKLQKISWEIIDEKK